MDDHSLDEFRRRWQEELAQAQALRKRRRPEAAERRPRRPEVVSGRGEQQASGYLALAQGLLEGAGRPPAARATRAERQEAASRSRSPPARDAAGGGEQLVDQLIRDLVSKTWKVIAEDEVLWYRLCQQEGHLPESSISDYSCWKLVFQECRAKEHMLRTNWKVGSGQYTSGDVRVWDTRTWDYTAPFLESEFEEDEPGMQPYVSFVRINSSLAVAAYEDGNARHKAGQAILKLGKKSLIISMAIISYTTSHAPNFHYIVKSEPPKSICLKVGTMRYFRINSALGYVLDEVHLPYLGSNAVYVILHRDTYRTVHLVYFHTHVSYHMSLRIQLLMIHKCAAGFRLNIRKPYRYARGTSLFSNSHGLTLTSVPMCSRHPVRHISFNSHSLITAHVPYERVVRSADLDNFATHRRHRGLIQAYAFAVDQLAFQSAVPICRSSCDAMPGYNYDLALAFPPDSI
ncbi:hypothetical protein FD755_017894 [Muntiacus reevesi]|uniref:Uncharacterized protein n=1 Tax=Muntiacus reevesi TaxID=9886 RepID=A0A5N3X7X7_MUNRE|nr:hypothetical protein FD755_017894 [Muntiacus reevesi]